MLLTIIIQLLLLLDVLLSIPSSFSSSVSEVVAFTIHLFFIFLLNTSASAFSTTLRISYILKMNFPLIAICFPFLYSLRTYNSFLYLVFSFYKRVFLDIVLLKATSNCLIYYFIGVLRVEEWTILLTSNVTSYNLVPSSSKLSSRE